MAAIIAWLVVMMLQTAGTDPSAVLESAYSDRDLDLDITPESEAWARAPRVVAIRARAGKMIEGRQSLRRVESKAGSDS